MRFTDPIRGSLRSYVDPSDFILFQFNPSQIEDTSATRYASQNIPGVHHPRYQYAGGDGRVIGFDIQLFAADQEGRSVRERALYLQGLTYPDTFAESIQNRAPRKMILNMGDLYKNFLCHVDSAKVNYQNLFTQTLNPLHAIISLSLREDVTTAVGWRSLNN